MNPLFFNSSTNRRSTKSSGLAFAALGSRLAWISRVFFNPSTVGISVLDQQLPAGVVDLLEEGATRPARIFLHDLHHWVFVAFVVVDRFRHSPNHAPYEIGIFPNHPPGGYCTRKLERNIELGHVDNHLEAEFLSSNLFPFDSHREVALSARYSRHPGRCAAHGDSSDIFERKTDSFEGQPQSEVRRGTRYMHGCRSSFEIFRRFNLRLAKYEIRQRVDQAVDDGDIPARQFAVDDRGPYAAREV